MCTILADEFAIYNLKNKRENRRSTYILRKVQKKTSRYLYIHNIPALYELIEEIKIMRYPEFDDKDHLT